MTRFKGHWLWGRRGGWNCKGSETQVTLSNWRAREWSLLQHWTVMMKCLPEKWVRKKKKTFLWVLQEPKLQHCCWWGGLTWLSFHSLFRFYFWICPWIIVTGVGWMFVLVMRQQHPKVCHWVGQSITPLSLKGPSGHILRRANIAVHSACIYYVFYGLEVAYSMLISLLCHA